MGFASPGILSSWTGTSSSLSQRTGTRSLQRRAFSVLSKNSSASRSNSISGPGSHSVSRSNPASAQAPATDSAGTGVSSSRLGTSGFGQSSAPAIVSSRLDASSSGISGNFAVPMSTSGVAVSLDPLTNISDDPVFTGSSSGPTAGRATTKPVESPATVSGHTLSSGAARISINVNENLSPSLDVSPTTGLAPDSPLGAMTPSISTFSSSAYTPNGFVPIGSPHSGLTITNSPAALSGQSSSNTTSKLIAALPKMTPGSLPIIASANNLSLPAPSSGGAVSIDRALTHLPTLSTMSSASPGSNYGDVAVSVTKSAPKSTDTESRSTTAPRPEPDAITSTATVQPSNASTQGVTNTAFSANYWLTTQVGGQTTVVPVVVGCPGCGGIGGGIILWNFPPIPSVSFQFPKINLPPISFPCIPIPLIKSCSKPPKSGSSSESIKSVSVH